MLKVSVVAFKSLSDAEKNEASNNGHGKEYSSYIRVELDGQTIALESDAMEPEDVNFYRDLYWVPKLLQKCYEIGVADGLLHIDNMVDIPMQAQLPPQ